MIAHWPGRRTGRSLALLLVLATTAACQMDGGGLQPLNNGPAPPSPSDQVHEAVDGLVVGHRLMAAGEYELALRAYYRAAAEDGMTGDVLSAIGSANLKLGRVHQAELVLRRALELDPQNISAMNNLGVVLMSEGKFSEARLVLRNAYGLDSGQSDEIRENLKLAIAKSENSAYDPGQQSNNYSLVRRGNGRYLLLSTPK